MFSHVNLGSNDLNRAKRFYDALLAITGAEPGLEMNVNSPRIVYQHQGCLLVITTPLDGQPATPANGGTIGFTLDSPEQVNAFHTTALDHGGSTCEDPPGQRDLPVGSFYLAYVRDPDGNKLCAFHSLI